MKIKMKKVLSVLIAIMMMFSSLPNEIIVAEVGGLYIELTFPDESLRYVVKQECDRDGDGMLSDEEIEKITSIEVRSVGNIEGLQVFKELKKITLFAVREESNIDLSPFTKLEELTIESCYKLTNIDLSNNNQLRGLRLIDNELLERINLSQNNQLVYMTITQNSSLESIDLSNSARFESLLANENKSLKSIDLSHNPKLNYLECIDNESLVSVDISQNSELEQVRCEDNESLTSLNLGYAPILTSLACCNNKITSLDVSGCPELIYLNCSSNQLTNIDVNNNLLLEQFDCSSNQLTLLDVSNNQQLISLYCSSNQLTSIDVSNNSLLDTFNCDNNKLTILDISNNQNMVLLNCSFNKLITLDTTNNPLIIYLDCRFNELTALYLCNDGYDYSNSSDNRMTLYCDCNHLTSLQINSQIDYQCSYNSYPCSHNTYTIRLDENNQFDLSTLPGNFDPQKIVGWKNNVAEQVDGNIFTGTEAGTGVTYYYNCSIDSEEIITVYLLIENPQKHNHNLLYYIGQEASCTVNGSKSYYGCSCGKYFEDETCTTEIIDINAWTENEGKIPATGHHYETTTIEATLSENGSQTSQCTKCGDIAPYTTIYHPETIKLSTTSYVYDGKVKKPSVMVIDANGETIPSTNYTVTYASNRKNIGKYAVKITFKEKYSGSKTLYFTINPKPTSSITTKLYGHDDVKVSWDKVSGASGYKVYYRKSASSTYTYIGKTTKTYMNKANLSDGTKYYFKVIAYKNIDGTSFNSSGKASSIYTLKKTSNVKISKSSSSKIKISWGNMSGESGYQIYRSTSKNGKYSRIGSVSSKYSSKIVSTTKGKGYYYKVRAYRSIGSGQYIYAPFSSPIYYKLK